MEKLVASRLNPQKLSKFKKYIDRRLEGIPLNILEVSQPISQKEQQQKKQGKENPPKYTEDFIGTKEDKSTGTQTKYPLFPSDLDEVWKYFYQQLKGEN